ncbi:MAG: hypothetical protein WD802_03160 [Gemmatimonadaceae bacterium]
MTIRVELPVFSPADTLIVAIPTPTPVTSPDSSTAATKGFELAQANVAGAPAFAVAPIWTLSPTTIAGAGLVTINPPGDVGVSMQERVSTATRPEIAAYQLRRGGRGRQLE